MVVDDPILVKVYTSYSRANEKVAHAFVTCQCYQTVEYQGSYMQIETFYMVKNLIEMYSVLHEAVDDSTASQGCASINNDPRPVSLRISTMHTFWNQIVIIDEHGFDSLNWRWYHRQISEEMHHSK